MAQGNLLKKAFFEEKIVDISDAKVSIATNSLQYGAGCFGGIRGYVSKNGDVNIFRIDDHIERLLNSAKILRFPINFDKNFVKNAILETMKLNSPKTDIYIRPFIYRSDEGISPGFFGKFDLAVYGLELSEYHSISKGLNICVSSWTRISEKNIPPRTKAIGGYVNSSLAIEEAKRGNFDDAIMLDERGKVSEGSAMNIFLVKNGKIFTPSTTSSILEGITRRSLMQIAKDENLEVIERDIDRSELYTADEVFFSGTGVQVSWVEKIDGVLIRKEIGEITKLMQTKFFEIVRGENQKYMHWLTKI